MAAPADSLKADGGTGLGATDLQAEWTHTHAHPRTPGASHSHPRPRTAALSETKQPNTVFRKRILKQSQKNGNQLSVLFQGREKTSFPTGLRLWLGGEEGRPGAQALGDADRTRVRHSAGGKGSCRATGPDGHWGQLWKQAFIFPEMSLLCSSWQEKGFRKMHAWGTRRQPLTPFSPWHKPYNTEERPQVWQRSLQQSSSLQSLQETDSRRLSILQFLS